VFPHEDSRCFVCFPREEHLFPKQKAVGRGFFLRASTRPSRSPYYSGATLRVRLCDTLLFFTSPRPTGSMLPSRLHSTFLWSAFQSSLKVHWLHLIPVSSAVLQAATAPCLHFKPLDLLSRYLTFAFVRAEEDFSSLILVHPMWLHRHHVFAPLRRDFVSTTSPTRRSGACETWVPMGPHRPRSQRSLSSGPDLPKALPTCKWARRPYPQSRRPWKALDDLILIAGDLPGLWSKILLGSRWRRRQ
jgi:hypothetical protein